MTSSIGKSPFVYIPSDSDSGGDMSTGTPIEFTDGEEDDFESFSLDKPDPKKIPNPDLVTTNDLIAFAIYQDEKVSTMLVMCGFDISEYTKVTSDQFLLDLHGFLTTQNDMYRISDDTIQQIMNRITDRDYLYRFLTELYRRHQL